MFCAAGRALAVDFVAVIAVFFAVAIPIASVCSEQQHLNVHLDLKPVENWYGTIFPVLYFAPVVRRKNGRTSGKWLNGIRIVSVTHKRIGFWRRPERALGYWAWLLEAGSGVFPISCAPYAANRVRPDCRDHGGAVAKLS